MMKLQNSTFCAVLFLLFLFSVQAICGWDVSPSETQYTYNPGETFTVDILISGDGKDVDALGFDLHFPGELLEYSTYTFTGTLLDGWMFKQVSLLSEGVLRIAGFTTTGIITSGSSGSLIKIDFTVKAGASGSGTIFAEGFTDDLTGATSQSATVSVGGTGFSVAGSVLYYNNNKPVANDTLALNGFEAVTDGAGAYTITNVAGGNYTLTSSKSGGVGNCVSAYDASFILRYAVGLITLTPYQLIAADVTGNNTVSAFDASYILRKVVGLISAFPVADEWTFVPTSFVIDLTNWGTAPDSIEFAPLDENVSGQDFKAIVYGDVSGNWTAFNTTRIPVAVEVSAGAPKKLADNNYSLPYEIRLAEATFSGSAVFHFDQSKMDFLSATVQHQQSDVIFEYAEQSGELKLAFVSSLPMEAGAVVVNLIFKKPDPVIDFCPDLTLTELSLDDKNAVFAVENYFAEPEVPSSFELLQNHPNPFNPETTIYFRLPAFAPVRIDIYNQLGQSVRTLLDENRAAGVHAVTWDGMDNNDNPVGSGIYFYRLQSGKDSSIKKMLLVR